MMEISIALLTGSIMGVTFALIAYVLLKRYIEQLKNESIFQLREWLNSEAGQKTIYSLGALIAQGAKGGFGISKGSGKLSLNNLILEIAGKWFGSKQNSSNEGSSQPALPNETHKYKY